MAKKAVSEEKRLLIEAHKINYRLRSTFFYRKLYEYKTITFPDVINQRIPSAGRYNWDNYSGWGISDDAFKKIQECDLELIQVFAHPQLLREHPSLTAYYRNIAALSQKATTYLAGCAPGNYEDGKKAKMSEDVAVAFSRLFNEHISLIVENAPSSFRRDELHAILFASTGAQIDGSWRNSIGEEAEKVVQTMIVQEAIERKLLKAFIMRENSRRIDPTPEVIDQVIKNIREIKGVMLANQKLVLFSSEPDLTFVNEAGQSELVIEVKGGTDPAGALERYGAAKKSFQHERSSNEHVITCLIASCITTEVESRINADSDITKYFNLTQLLTDEEMKLDMLNYLFSLLTGVDLTPDRDIV